MKESERREIMYVQLCTCVFSKKKLIKSTQCVATVDLYNLVCDFRSIMFPFICWPLMFREQLVREI
jgi:hypothetical protein